MDALLPLWIIGSVLVLAVVDRMSTGKSTTTFRQHQSGYPTDDRSLAGA